MPSWNIHTAHVERLLAENQMQDMGIADSNVFLFGNYVPDVYLGFMVHDTTYRLDYCLTHNAQPNVIPIPDANRFWDECIWHRTRKPKSPEVLALTLGAWAHLAADRIYNASFREFCETHDTPKGDELRQRKQADFALFGSSLDISSIVEITPSLLDAANRFRPYSILPDDVHRAVDVASAITNSSGKRPKAGTYQLLSSTWMHSTFDACHEFLATWLTTWQALIHDNRPAAAGDICRQAGL